MTHILLTLPEDINWLSWIFKKFQTGQFVFSAPSSFPTRLAGSLFGNYVIITYVAVDLYFTLDFLTTGPLSSVPRKIVDDVTKFIQKRLCRYTGMPSHYSLVDVEAYVWVKPGFSTVR